MTNQEKNSLVFLVWFVVQCTLICLFTSIIGNINSLLEPFVPLVDILSIVTLGYFNKDKFAKVLQGIYNHG